MTKRGLIKWKWRIFNAGKPIMYYYIHMPQFMTSFYHNGANTCYPLYMHGLYWLWPYWLLTILIFIFCIITIIGIHSYLFDSLESNLHRFRFKHVLHESQESDLALQVWHQRIIGRRNTIASSQVRTLLYTATFVTIATNL